MFKQGHLFGKGIGNIILMFNYIYVGTLFFGKGNKKYNFDV